MDGQLNRLTSSLNGPFRLVSQDTGVVELKSMKSRALLILLATGKGGQRSRAWLEATLWGRADRAKVKACLRQELSKLRRGLEPHGVDIAANRHELIIDFAQVALKQDAAAGKFLEGFHLDEPAFGDWLSRQRLLSAETAGAPAVPAVPYMRASGGGAARGREGWNVVIDVAGKDGPENWFAQLFSDAVASNIREVLTVPATIGRGTRCDDPNTLRVTAQMHRLDDGMGIRVALNRDTLDAQLWSGHCTIRLTGAPPVEHPRVVSLIAQLVAAIRHFLFRARHEKSLAAPDALYERAMRDIFSVQADRVARADALLAEAHEDHPRGLYLASRAQIRAIQRVERFEGDTERLIDEAESYLAKSLEDEPRNSMVLALASNTAGHLMRNPDRSLEFAGRSARINPSNAMAWWSLSSANMYIGNVKSSLEYAARGLQLAEFLQFRFWWGQQAFGAVFSLGRHEEALTLLTSVHAENPAYRPPLRYMISLYAHYGMDEEFEQALSSLQRLEPDFDVRRMYEDRGYPASLIHKSPGLKTEALKDYF